MQNPGKNENEGPLVIKAENSAIKGNLKTALKNIHTVFLFLQLFSPAHAYTPFPHWTSLTKLEHTIFEFKFKQVKNVIIMNFKTLTVIEH